MSLNKNNIAIFFITLLTALGFSQNAVRVDSTKTQELGEIVVTAQFNPTSIKKSVHNVIVIKREQIENQAANNLADLLNFNLNLTILPNAQTGQSKISFFGLDAQYFTVLMDNIPMVSDNGLGNNIDLTQINLDDIERIEIVEGAMGVEYGANAVSGVINIITKKSINTDWYVEISAQEETVSNEYAWFDEGRHIQTASVAHNINEHWFARAGINRNQFAGFFDNRYGKNYYKNDGLRGYEWLPKTQINTNAFVNYTSDKFKVFYKFEYFNETLNFYDAAVRANINTQSQTSNPSATDKIFTTNRFVNNININGRLNSGANYNLALSYQEQKRDLNKFNYYILSKERSNETDGTYQSSKVFFSKGTINQLLKNDHYNFQLGYETRVMEGFDTQASGDITQLGEIRKQHSFALFSASEWDVSPAFSLRPGLRFEYNSKFDSKLLGSLSARYLLKDGFELRGNVGTSYRTPNFEELYYYFVDSNHDVQGNQELKPENGYSAFLNLKKQTWLHSFSMTNGLKLSYIDVNDKIDLAIVNTTPLQYQYINIDTYRLWGLTSDNSIKKDNWTFNLGATLQGVARVINSEANAKNDFLYAFQLNTSGTYLIEKWDTSLTLLLKYNGKQQDYFATGTDSNGDSVFSKSATDAYTWMDASVRKSFFNKSLEATLGGRNLLDVTKVSVSDALSGGTHSGNNSNLLLGYGRSFYLKLQYNLNF